MDIHWHKLLLKLTTWLALEIILNFIGLDNMADYGEFIFTYNNTSTSSVDVSFN